MLCPKPRWLIINDLLEEIHGVKKADAAEEWANALDAAESAAIEGRPEVSSIAVAIAVAREGTLTYDVHWNFAPPLPHPSHFYHRYKVAHLLAN